MQNPSENAETSLSLLERARKQDAGAWQRVVQLYSPLVFFWAKRCGLGNEQAADIVQDVWASVSISLERFRKDHSGGSFRAWLWTITRNKVRDSCRRDPRAADASGGTAAQMFFESIPDQEPVDDTHTAEHQLLHRALGMIRNDFEERTWQAFWRMTVDEVPAATVAEELQMAPNAVHQARFRVLRRLRLEMDGLIDAPVL